MAQIKRNGLSTNTTTLVKIIVILTIAKLSVGITSKHGYCPDPNDLPNSGSCFEFVENENVTTYDEAQLFCQSKDKQLADIKSQQQLTFITGVMQRQLWSQAFVGLKFVRNGWNWIETDKPLRGQGCSESAYDQGSDQLFTISGTSMTHEQCINFCSMNGKFYAAVQQGFFCYCSESYIWPQTASNCSLPCSGSADQNCGTMLNSLAFYAADGAYDNWLPGRPSLHGICAAVQVDRTNNEWVDYSCAAALPFICRTTYEVVESMDDADGSSCGDGVCYYLFTKQLLSWKNADRYCIRKGGRLAAIEKSYRQDIINLLLFPTQLQPNALVWIGAVNYQWFQQGSKLEFDGWITENEPVAPETYPCAAAVSLGNRYGLRTTKCNDLTEGQNRFLCVSPALGYHTTTTAALTTTVATTTPTTTSSTTTTTTTTTTPLPTTTTSTTTASTTTTTLATTTTTAPTTTTTAKTTTTKPLTTTTTVTTTTSDAPTTTTEEKTTTPIPTTMLALCNVTCRNVSKLSNDSGTLESTETECFHRHSPKEQQPPATLPATVTPSTAASSNSPATPPSASSTTKKADGMYPTFVVVWFEDIVPCFAVKNGTARPITQVATTPGATAPLLLAPVGAAAQKNTSGQPGHPWWVILVIALGCVTVVTAIGVALGVYFKNRRAETGGRPRQQSPARNRILPERADTVEEIA